MATNKSHDTELNEALFDVTHRAWLARLAYNPENIEEIDPAECEFEAGTLAKRLAMDTMTRQVGG